MLPTCVISVLLISQAFSTVAADTLVRKAVSATGEALDFRTPTSAKGVAPNGDGHVETRGEELLEEVENMLKSGTLNPEDANSINVIKNLVNQKLLPDLHETRDAAQDQIKTNIAAISSCNSGSTARQQAVKSSTEAATGTTRRQHASCREEEKNKHGEKNDRCSKLDNYLNAIVVPAELPAGRPRAGMVDYVETMSEYFCGKTPEVTDLDEDCKRAEKEHADHQALCNRKQAVFESSFCVWRTQLTDVCAELDTCYANAVQAWQDHVTATNVLVEKWKVEFRALHKINCYTDVWLSDNNANTVDAGQYEKCKNSEESATEMEVDAGEKPAKATCDLTPVETYPGTSNFPEVEYAEFAEYAITPIPCPEVGIPEEATTTEVMTTTVPPEIDDGKWRLVHYCTHCGARGSSWEGGLSDENACGERCDGMGKPLLIFNHQYKNCRCYEKSHCTEDKRVTSNQPDCHYHVYGNGKEF